MKLKVYTDTSVIGGYYDEEFRDGSIQLINDFREGNKILVLSDITLREIEIAPAKVKQILKSIPIDNVEYLSFNEEAKFLSDKYIEEEVVTVKHLLDAQHIAIASINHIDVLVSWNFKHIVNLKKIHLYNSTNLKYGYPMIEIRTPKEVIDEEL